MLAVGHITLFVGFAYLDADALGGMKSHKFGERIGIGTSRGPVSLFGRRQVSQVLLHAGVKGRRSEL